MNTRDNLLGINYHLILKMLDSMKMFWKSQPEYKFYFKCHDEQFHFSNPQDDMIERTGQVVVIRRIQVI